MVSPQRFLLLGISGQALGIVLDFIDHMQTSKSPASPLHNVGIEEVMRCLCDEKTTNGSKTESERKCAPKEYHTLEGLISVLNRIQATQIFENIIRSPHIALRFRILITMQSFCTSSTDNSDFKLCPFFENNTKRGFLVFVCSISPANL